MTDIHRVPLQPVAKGTLGKLWLGIAVAVALGGAVAYESRQRGLQVETLKAGAGASPTMADYVLVNYVGHLANGKEFDRGDHIPIPVQGVIPGFSKALLQMQKGGRYHVVIPARLAYGAQEKRDQAGEVSIPANSDLVFDIDLIDFKNAEEFMRQRMLMQQLQQQMQAGGAGSAPGSAPGGAPAPGGDPAQSPH